MPNPTKSWAKNCAEHLRVNGLFHAVGLMAILGLKLYYSNADAGDLRWILAPLAQLVGLLSGIQFQWDAHAGFISHSREVVIAPACTGVNFMIICFATIYFSSLPRLRGTARKCGWFCLCIAAAYLLTLCTNTVRILVSLYLYGAPVYGGWITPERVHRLAGTLIYVSTLVAAFLAVERLLGRSRRPAAHEPVRKNRGKGCFPTVHTTFPVPLAWYVLVMVFVPLLNGALNRNGSLFWEHTALILATCLCISAIPASIAAIPMNGKNRRKKSQVTNGKRLT
jgi:exosortase K